MAYLTAFLLGLVVGFIWFYIVKPIIDEHRER